MYLGLGFGAYLGLGFGISLGLGFHSRGPMALCMGQNESYSILS